MKASHLGQTLSTEEIISQIISKIGAKGDKQVYLVFFDFDGTIIHGDITEGLGPESSCGGYDGLIKLSILAGLCHEHEGESGHQDFFEKYQKLVEIDELSSIEIISKLVSDLPEKKSLALNKLIEKHFDQTLKKRIFSSSFKILEKCIEEGVIPYVISASPDPFVKGAKKHLPIPEENLLGVCLERKKSGDFSEDQLHHGIGKVNIMNEIISKHESAGQKVQVVAGLGNNWEADGPFLKEISKKGGVGVLINGINRSEDDSLQGVKEISFRETLG